MEKILKFLKSKKGIFVSIFTALFAFYTLFGFFGVPYIITEILPKKMPQNANLSVQKAKFNPFTYELNITNIDIYSDKPLFKAQNIDADIKFLDFFKKSLSFEILNFKNPEINIEKSQNGEFNFSAFLSQNNTSTENSNESSNFNFVLNALKIENGTIKYNDNSLKKPFSVEFDKINYEIKDFDLLQNLAGKHHFDSNSTIAENVDIKSKITLNPFKIYGILDIKNLSINPVSLSFVNSDDFELLSGILNTKTRYFLEFGDDLKFGIKDSNLSIKDAKFNLKNLNLSTKVENFEILGVNFKLDNNQTILNLSNANVLNSELLAKNLKFLDFKNLSLENLNYDIKNENLNLEKISLNSPNFTSEITQNGVVAINSIMPKQKSENNESLNLKFQIANAEINNAAIDILESFLVKNRHKIENVNLSTKNITQDFSKPLEILANINSSQISLNSQSNLQISPLNFSSSLEISLKNLGYFNPYVNEFLFADIKSGNLNAKGNLKFAKNLDFSGSLSVSNFSLNDKKNAKIFTLKSLNIKNTNLTQNGINLENIDISSPYAKLAIDKNHNFNLIDIIKPRKNGTSKSKSTFETNLKNININSGEIDFSDHSLFIPFDIKISKVKTNINKVASKGITKLDFKGLVDKNGIGEIKIVTLPFDYEKMSNLGVIFKNVALKDATPYSAKFMGYEIKDGKLNLKLDYKIKNRKLNATNSINLDHFTLGEKVESKDNVNLPISLAISILTDQNGQINVDLPVSGDLSNPEFSYGGIVWSAIGKLFADIVLSPFRFIGNALGIDTSKLDGIDFEFASSEILDSENEKFENLAKISQEKPEIKITLTPTYNEKGDTWAFKTESFHREIDLIINKSSKSYKDALLYLKNRYSIREDKNLQNLIIEEQKFTPSRLEDLAKKRAENVKEKLVQMGVKSDKIVIKSVKKTDAKQETYVPLLLGIEK